MFPSLTRFIVRKARSAHAFVDKAVVKSVEMHGLALAHEVDKAYEESNNSYKQADILSAAAEHMAETALEQRRAAQNKAQAASAEMDSLGYPIIY